MNAKIVLIPLASLAVIGGAALLSMKTPPPAPDCQVAKPIIEPAVEPPDHDLVPRRRFARPPAPPTPAPQAPLTAPVA